VNHIPLALSLALGASLPAFAADAAADAAADGATWNPNADQAAVYKALLVRHDSPTCDELDAMSADPVGTYGYLVDHAEQPAWVAMRAARCLMVNHSDDAAPRMRQWVTDPALRGLGILTVTNLDLVALDLATQLATLALTDGPDPDGMRKRLQRFDTPELRALADMPVDPTAGGAEGTTADPSQVEE